MMVHPLIVIVLVASLAGAVAFVSMVQSIRKFRVIKAARNGIIVLLSFSLTASAGLLYIANHGYQAFTREETAATVSITPTGQQQFTARFLFPDSSEQEFAVAGDQLYVDAHILKWHPLLNLIGIHTTYELDRVAGRYLTLEDERAKPRTVYSLSKTGTLNMFHLRKKMVRLKPILDAYYGSATFVGTESTASVRIVVSVSGLMVRDAAD